MAPLNGWCYTIENSLVSALCAALLVLGPVRWWNPVSIIGQAGDPRFLRCWLRQTINERTGCIAGRLAMTIRQMRGDHGKQPAQVVPVIPQFDEHTGV